MIPTRLRILALVAVAAGLMGQSCVTVPTFMGDGEPEAIPVEAPSAIEEAAGQGRQSVFREKNLNARGHRVYKALRQEETLNAFLECQGEPDYVEVKPAEGGGAPSIVLTYTRRSATERGTVDITPSRSGYYVASPIEPPQPTRPPPPPESATPEKKPPKADTPPPPRPPPPEAPPDPVEKKIAEEPEPPIEEPSEPEEPAPLGPQPTEAQLDECPIEDWRRDCQELCIEGATWEWCSY